MDQVYKSSKIYKIIGIDGYYYIGSTTSELRFRLNNHKQLAKKYPERYEYKHMNTIGWDKYTIELIEDYECSSKKELNSRTKHLIKQSKHDKYCLNHKKKTEKLATKITNEVIDNDIDDDILSKYKDGKIYKLQCKDGHYYIGSTIQTLTNRFSSHKSASKTQTSHAYQYINTIGWENVMIELLEVYPCKSKAELVKKEDDYLKQHIENPMCLNRHRSYLTAEEDKQKKKQYYEENKEDLLEYQRKYKEENRDYILHRSAHYRLTHAEELAEKQKEYVTKNKEKVKEARHQRYEKNKEIELQQHKEYVQSHQEKVQQYKKEWAQRYKKTHADEIAEKRANKRAIREEKKQARIKHDQTIVACECGGSYQHYRKNRHLESKKHQHFVTSN